MYLIEQPDPPERFLDAWFAGAEHLQRKGDGHLMWIRANPYKPFIEHLSFRMGNQMFWVFIEMHEGMYGVRVKGQSKTISSATAWRVYSVPLL